MKIRLLRPMNKAADTWSPWYDKTFGFVVRAETKKGARAIANENGGSEVKPGNDTWLDRKLTTCEELTAEGLVGVVIKDHEAGR